MAIPADFHQTSKAIGGDKWGNQLNTFLNNAGADDSWNGTTVAATTSVASPKITTDIANADTVPYAQVSENAASSVVGVYADASNRLIITGINASGTVSIASTAETGKFLLSLTDNLADALSIGISSGNDLLVFKTTNNAEEVIQAADLTAASGASDFRCRQRVRFFEDFLGDTTDTLQPPLTATSSGGSPTIDYVANAINGEFELTHDATAGQTLYLYFGDQVVIDPTKNPIFEARFKIDFASAPLTADQRVVIGLASAYNATFDDIASNAWFRVEGADLSIWYESDDGTVDDDDNDSGVDIADGTYVTVRIDMSVPATTTFYINGSSVGTTDTSNLTASNKLQFFMGIQKDAGTETDSVVLDYVMMEWDRT